MMETFKEEQKRLRAEVREKTIGYILGALGLVAGLAWNDAIKTAIESVFPPGGSGDIIAKFIYAAIITVGVAVSAYYISKFFVKAKE